MKNTRMMILEKKEADTFRTWINTQSYGVPDELRPIAISPLLGAYGVMGYCITVIGTPPHGTYIFTLRPQAGIHVPIHARKSTRKGSELANELAVELIKIAKLPLTEGYQTNQLRSVIMGTKDAMKGVIEIYKTKAVSVDYCDYVAEMSWSYRSPTDFGFAATTFGEVEEGQLFVSNLGSHVLLKKYDGMMAYPEGDEPLPNSPNDYDIPEWEYMEVPLDAVVYKLVHKGDPDFASSSNDKHNRWSQLVKLEPRLGELFDEAKRIDGSDKNFCANRVWYKAGKDGGLREKLISLVGWYAENDSPLLKMQSSYDTAYSYIYNSLPPCKDCICF